METYKNIVLKLLTRFVYIFSIIQVAKKTIYSENLEWSNWAYSDYLISFPEKYIRRGILGEFFLQIDKDGFLFDTIQRYVFFNFLIFCLLLYFFFKKFKVNISLQFTLLFSSFGLFHMSTYDVFYFRREILIFNFFMIYLFLLKKLDNNKINNFLTYLLLFLVFLIHEGIVILIFPFVLLSLSKNKDILFNLHKIRFFYLLLLVISLFFKGTYSDSKIIWDNINELDKLAMGVPPSEFENLFGAISALNWTIFQAFKLSFNTIFSGNLVYWLGVSFLAILPIYYCFFYNTNYLNKIRYKISLFKFDLLPVIFIFLIGWDWGRWINILFYFAVLTLISLSEDPLKDFNELKISNLSFIFMISFFSIVPECCINSQAPRMLDNFNRIFESIKILIN